MKKLISLTLILTMNIIFTACSSYKNDFGSENKACNEAVKEIRQRMSNSGASSSFPECDSFSIYLIEDDVFMVEGDVDVTRIGGSSLQREFFCEIEFFEKSEDVECFFK